MQTKLGNNKLYGLVNNAGIMSGSADDLLKTNVYGAKLMTDAFVPLLDSTRGRIVNVGSGAGPMHVQS